MITLVNTATTILKWVRSCDNREQLQVCEEAAKSLLCKYPDSNLALQIILSEIDEKAKQMPLTEDYSLTNSTKDETDRTNSYGN